MTQPLEIHTARGNVLRGSADGSVDAPTEVIFLHGFRSDCAGFKSTELRATALAAHARFACIDLSGHGQSEGRFEDFRLSALLSDVDTILEHFVMSAAPPRQFVLAGSSMGGWLAVLAAQRHPNLIAGLLLLAPAFNFIQQHFGTLPARELSAWQRAGIRRFESDYGLGQYALDYRVIADAAPFDQLSLPQTLQCPCFIVHGALDDTVPVDISRRFFEQLHAPLKKLEIIPDGDHRLHNGLGIARSMLKTLIHNSGRPPANRSP